MEVGTVESTAIGLRARQDEMRARNQQVALELERPCRTFEQHGLKIEQHYTPAQVAERLAISTDKARRMFQDEPGVVQIGEPSRRMGRVLKRRYYTMRIPASVAERVIARMSNKKGSR